jgi:hypothetical protein
MFPKGYHPPTEFKKGCRAPITAFKKGIIPWNKGKKTGKPAWNSGKKTGFEPWNKGKIGVYSIETLRAMSKSHKGVALPGRSFDKSVHWKGDKVKYRALHQWVEKALGKPNLCQNCKNVFIGRNKINWANKSHKYLRNINDWIRLCVSCHKKYDNHSLVIT